MRRSQAQLELGRRLFACLPGHMHGGEDDAKQDRGGSWVTTLTNKEKSNVETE